MAVGCSVAGDVGVGGSGVKVAKGVDGSGVGIFPTGSTVFLKYVLHTSYRHSNRDRMAGIW